MNKKIIYPAIIIYVLGVIFLIGSYASSTLSAGGYPDGTLLKTANSEKVYVIWHNKKRWLKTSEVFNSYSYRWPGIKIVSSAELDSISVNNLVRLEGSARVYALSDLGYKRHILSPAVFNSYGLSWTDIRPINQTEFDSYPDCTLIKIPDDSKVYFISNGHKKIISDSELTKYNLESTQIINEIDFDTYILDGLSDNKKI